jgi:Ni,Fe-hydrogenase III small subunit
MAGPLALILDAVPRPRVVVACGDYALGTGVFSGGYGVEDGGGDPRAAIVPDFPLANKSFNLSYADNDL